MYFLEAARVCLFIEQLEWEEAENEIKQVYDEWKVSKYYTNRSWENVKVKIKEVYDNPDKWEIKPGKKLGSGSSEIDRTKIALSYLKHPERKFFSDKPLKTIHENKGGYLELINDILPSELFEMNPQVETADIREIINKIMLGADDMPLTNKNLIFFKNGIFDVRLEKLVDTQEIADMGFPEYDWLEPTKENEPKEFLKFFKSYEEKDLPRFYAGIKGIFDGYLDSRISVLVGISRVGKTTIMSIICKALTPRYGLSVDLDTFMEDKPTRSMINKMRLVIFQDLPDTWKNFAIIKNITGESLTVLREMYKKGDNSNINKIKIFATANLLPPIKSTQKNAMYSDRLSILHNIETKMFKSDKKLEDKILEAEAEKIISWCVNIPDSKCAYEDGDIVRKEWEDLANPHYDWIDTEYFVNGDSTFTIPVIKLCELFKIKDEKSREVSVEAMKIALKTLGYTVRDNICKNITEKPKPKKADAKTKTVPFKHTDDNI